MDKEFLSVAEFSAIEDISKQRVYQRLNNDLKEFVQVIDKQKYISIKALSPKGLKRFEQGLNNDFNEFEQDLNKDFQPFFEKQIAEKDKQIEKLFEMIAEKDKQIENLQNLLSQSQHLQAIDRQLLLENQKKKKKGFLKLFGRKETADNERDI